MDAAKIKLYFLALSALAVSLLWGISCLNGTVEVLLLSVWRGRLPDGLPLKTDYTGIVIFDYPISALVAFFFYGTNGSEEGFQLFLVDAYSTLQSAFVWLYVESARSGRKPKWVTRPIWFGLLWQAVGGAIALPLYYACHVRWGLKDGARANSQHIPTAKAIPFGFIIGAIAPAIVGMAPTWLGSASRSPTQHQIILATWQPDPLWVSWIIVILAQTITTTKTRSEKRPVAYNWTLTSYFIAGVSSLVGHIYAIGRILTAADPSTSLWRIYIPFPGWLSGPTGSKNALASGTWLFLQYDLILISLSSLSWAYFLLGGISKGSKVQLSMLMGIGALTIGPGATVSFALFYREQILLERTKV